MAHSPRVAATVKLADVQAAYSGTGIWLNSGSPDPLVDGDTLVIPQGDTGTTNAWGSPLTVNKAIYIEGQGAQTSIRASTGTAFIVNITAQPAGAGHNVSIGKMIVTGAGASASFVINGNNWDSYHRGFRIHHIRHIRPSGGYTFDFNNACVGVVDHCSFLFNDVNSGETFFAQFDNVDSSVQGDGSYTHSRSLFNMLYMEDCVYGRTFDGQHGGRMTVRHCTYDPVSGQGQITHGGLDSSARGRGMFQLDIYNNIYKKRDTPFVGFRGGNGRVFNNDGTGDYQNALTLYNYRMGSFAGNAWRGTARGSGGADGTTVFDKNDRAAHTFGGVTLDPTLRTCLPNSDYVTPKTNPPCNPTGAAGQYQGAVYASMTYDGTEGASKTSLPMTISFPATAMLPATPVDSWKYFTLRNLGIGGVGSNVDNFAVIVASNTLPGGRIQLTLDSQGTAATGVQSGFTLATGNQCEIRHVLECIDSMCRGRGELIQGNLPVLASTGLPGPILQDNEHIYYWNNRTRLTLTGTGSTYSASTLDPIPAQAGVGPLGSNAPFTVHASDPAALIVLGPAPDMFWDANATGTNANYVGADDEVRDMFFGADPAAYVSRYQRTGTGGLEYPHWIVKDALPGAVEVIPPKITSASAVNFTVGATVSCGTTPKVNCHVVTTSDFSNGNTPAIIIISGSLPTNVTLSSGTISGTATGAAPGSYNVTLEARNATPNPDEVATQILTIQVAALVSNQPPTGVAVTKPLNGATFTAPASITLESSASDSDGNIVSIQYYYGGSNLIATIDATQTAAPYSYGWTGVAGGNYSLTVKATDNQGATTTSSAIAITVNAAATLAAPTIVVSG